MKCPNCGADMKNGSLYCEQCGEDIHIVPDYDLELELEIAQSVNTIIAEVNQETEEKKQTDSQPGREVYEKPLEPTAERKPVNKIKLLAWILTAILLCLAGVGGILLYCYHSYDYQLKQAIACTASNRYDKAIRYYSRALEINDQDIEVRFALAEAYYQKGNKIEYEYLLRDIIREEASTEMQLERAYGKLIAIYRDRGEYDTINEILLASKSSQIQNTYQSYIARAPEYSYQAGSYTEIIPLKLSSAVPGKIYYTLDGSEPNENSLLYTAPIFLENGDYVVKSFFVNEYGVASEIVSREYHISVMLANAPEISVISGEYDTPMMITVLDDDTQDVYYTTDGTTPDLHSNHYTGPIPMPLGKSRYIFAFVEEDGKVSELAEREYQLRLNTEISPEQAVEMITGKMIESGKILDAGGRYSEEEPGRYIYEFLYVMNIRNVGDFYVMAEVFCDAQGVLSRTGSFYAVNVYDGAMYKLQSDENNNYNLVDI